MTSRHWPTILVLLAGLLAAPGTIADQKDPRLDRLFAELRRAETAEAAQPIEAQIWNIWMHSGDDKIDALMSSAAVDPNLGGVKLSIDELKKQLARQSI